MPRRGPLSALSLRLCGGVCGVCRVWPLSAGGRREGRGRGAAVPVLFAVFPLSAAAANLLSTPLFSLLDSPSVTTPYAPLSTFVRDLSYIDIRELKNTHEPTAPHGQVGWYSILLRHGTLALARFEKG